jgi:predicted ATPase
MIVAIKIRNYKGIKRTPWINLDPFHVLVGPNGSGKSTFLDAIEFVKSCVVDGPLAAVEQRAPEYRDLTFLRQGGPIEFDLRLRFLDPPANALGTLEYRLAVTSDERLGVSISEELLTRVETGTRAGADARLLGKTHSGSDFYLRESGTYRDSFQFGPGKLALSLIPPDLQKYPTGNAIKNFLAQGVRYVQLNSTAMRQPSPATRPTELELDGTNLPRVVGSLLRNGSAGRSSAEGRSAVARWTEHLRYALDDLESIGWAARQPDNAEYLLLKFAGGLECPSWLLSDGTLRMLALTLPAFLSGPPSLYMVEEPENGVHPHALEIIVKALTAIPAAQVFVATHSPLVVQQVGVKPLLCFRRDEKTGVQILRGEKHPALKDWEGNPDLGSIFSSRVLG